MLMEGGNMAEFQMSMVKSRDFDRACLACQMAFGCIMYRENGHLEITSFESGDMEIIRDTLSEAGSVYLGGIAF